MPAPAAVQADLPAILARQKITVMGLGRFGGALGLIRFLASLNANLTVTDKASPETLSASLAQLKNLPGITCHIGAHPEADFTGSDVLFVNPAVPPDHPLVALARRSHARIATEIGLFLALCPAPVLAVTGTSGKSTTCALLSEMLSHDGRKIFLGGNAGGSLLPRLSEIDGESVVVLELSSFQLHYLSDPWPAFPAPAIAGWLNIYEDHLNWHHSFSAYMDSKNQILAGGGPDHWAVVPGDDGQILSRARKSGRRILAIGARPACAGAYVAGEESITCGTTEKGTAAMPLFNRHDMALAGAINLRNAQFAAAMAHLYGVSPEAIQQAVRSFKGLPHRMELIEHHRGIRYVNSSIATTPLEAASTLEAFDGPVLLMAGGAGEKELSFQPLAQAAGQRVRAAVFFGETTETLSQAFQQDAPGIPCKTIPGFDEAVDEALSRAQPGDTVLFAPGCPSFDAFVNFAARGDAFRRAVQENLK